MSERFTLTFKDLSSYEKYKKDIQDKGGVIVHDLGTLILGFTASIPVALVQAIQTQRANSLIDDHGITTFDADSTVSVQPIRP